MFEKLRQGRLVEPGSQHEQRRLERLSEEAGARRKIRDREDRQGHLEEVVSEHAHPGVDEHGFAVDSEPVVCVAPRSGFLGRRRIRVPLDFRGLLTEFMRGAPTTDDGDAGEVRAKRWINDAMHHVNGLEAWPFLEAAASGAAP